MTAGGAHDTLPKLNYEGSKDTLEQYILVVLVKNGYLRRTMRRWLAA